MFVFSDGVSGQRVIARHVCMDNLYLMLANKFGERAGAGSIEGVSQGKRCDAFFRNYFQLTNQRRARSCGEINFVATRGEAMGEINKMAFATSQ